MGLHLSKSANMDDSSVIFGGYDESMAPLDQIFWEKQVGDTYWAIKMKPAIGNDSNVISYSRNAVIDSGTSTSLIPLGNLKI